MNQLIRVKSATPVFFVALTCFGLSPVAQALLPPPTPDGGYPGGNTAEGDFALFSLENGANNTAVGSEALRGNRNGSENTATGWQALQDNFSGHENTANGDGALRRNVGGSDNTATGHNALDLNDGDRNTATGALALFSNDLGNNNTAVGFGALQLLGGFLTPPVPGNGNIALGFHAGFNHTTGNNNIDIGNAGVDGDSATIRIGRRETHRATFIAGISGATVINGVQVMVNANGKLGTMLSSARFKEAIKPMDKVSEAIFALKPVTFCYKEELDPKHIQQFGLIAEDVEGVNRDLVARDEEGKPYSVRYDQVNAMLLNEFLKEHQTVQELKSAAAKQEAMIARQQKQIEALSAGLQKVSAQLELDKPAPL
jgi:hypothetical protein